MSTIAKIPSSNENIEMIRQFYYDQKLSMREIAERIGVSLDAILSFMRKNDLKRRTYVEEAVTRFARKPYSFAPLYTLARDQESLKQAAVMLYWCEGGKAESLNGIDFANSDQRMVCVFLRFLREICCIDESRLRVYLYCYSNQKPQELIKFWSDVTKIPPAQFSKPYVREDFNLLKTGKMSKGMVHIRYSDKKLLQLMRQWIESYKEKFAPIV